MDLLPSCCAALPQVRIWEWATGVLKATIAAHPSNPIFGLTVLRDAVLVTGSADGTFAMWETYQYTQLWGPIRVRACAMGHRLPHVGSL